MARPAMLHRTNAATACVRPIQHGTYAIKRGPRVDRDALQSRIIVHRLGFSSYHQPSSE